MEQSPCVTSSVFVVCNRCLQILFLDNNMAVIELRCHRSNFFRHITFPRSGRKFVKCGAKPVTLEYASDVVTLSFQYSQLLSNCVLKVQMTRCVLNKQVMVLLACQVCFVSCRQRMMVNNLRGLYVTLQIGVIKASLSVAYITTRILVCYVILSVEC